MNIFTKLASFFNPQKQQNQDNISNTNSLTVSKHLSNFLEKEVLNGLDIPNLDPDKNTVQMDIFPTSVIDNIVVFASDIF